MSQLENWKKKFKELPHTEMTTEVFIEQLLLAQDKATEKRVRAEIYREIDNDLENSAWFKACEAIIEDRVRAECAEKIKKHPMSNHICRFNDGDSKCQCYTKARSDIARSIEGNK